MGQKDFRRSGFTLIELAVVLVIIGLIAGGILVGRDMITAATTRGIVTEIEAIKMSANVFRSKYDCLPGDCAAASQLLAPADGGCPTPADQVNPTTTCNGDGNGLIDSALETDLFFEHLSLAKMINQQVGLSAEGGNTTPVFSAYNNFGTPEPQTAYASHYLGTLYSGVRGGSSGSGYTVLGGGANGGFLAHWWNSFLAGALGSAPANFIGNAILLGGDGGNSLNYKPVMTATMAYAIDTKIDDGLPGTGNVQTWKDIFNYWPTNNLPYCYTTAVAATARYNLAASGNICALWITADF